MTIPHDTAAAPKRPPEFNPLSPDFIRDPHPHYHALRTYRRE
ncbi:MAG: hypothetical protein ACREFD_08530 [Stellaceae bacterium]